LLIYLDDGCSTNLSSKSPIGMIVSYSITICFDDHSDLLIVR